MKLSNMKSANGNEVPNQFIIENGNETIFQSYKTVIAVERKTAGKRPQIILDKHNWDYSRTTGKYRNLFLNECIAETRGKIKSGEYILEVLNQ